MSNVRSLTLVSFVESRNIPLHDSLFFNVSIQRRVFKDRIDSSETKERDQRSTVPVRTRDASPEAHLANYS